MPQIKHYISTSDISLLSQSLIILATLLELSPATSFPEVERDILKEIYTIAHSPLVSGAALDAMLVFFGALVHADNQIASHVVPSLVASAEKVPKAESSPANVAKCVAQVVKVQKGVAAGMIAEFSKHIKVSISNKSTITSLTNTPQATSKAKSSHVVMSLFILGEIGRFMYVLVLLNCPKKVNIFPSDMSLQGDVFNNTIEHFGDGQEEIRTAASFAAGLLLAHVYQGKDSPAFRKHRHW